MKASLSRIGEAPPFEAEFGPTGALRQDFGSKGRVHVDRPLPFIVLHRADRQAETSLARAVALTSPAYAVWNGPADDAAAAAALDAVIAEQSRHFGHILAIAVEDLPRPAPAADDAPVMPPFRAEIGAEGDGAPATAEALAAAMRKIEVDLRTCDVALLEAPRLPPHIPGLAERHAGLAWLSIGLPRVHEIPGGGIYPQLFHELAVATFDALLKAACQYMTETGLGPPRHYRGLGRSAFVDAAKKADAKLDRICRRFDFLLSVSPINTTQAFERFRADKWARAPAFRYRPLTVDPSEAKRELYRIDFRGVEDQIGRASCRERV